MDDLLKALIEVDEVTTKTVAMRRFGNFTIKSLDDREIKEIRDRATFPTKDGMKLDADKFKALFIVKGCVHPKWDEIDELKKKYGTNDAAEIVRKRLHPGEIERLYDEIQNLSGYSLDEAKVIDDLKNE